MKITQIIPIKADPFEKLSDFYNHFILFLHNVNSDMDKIKMAIKVIDLLHETISPVSNTDVKNDAIISLDENDISKISNELFNKKYKMNLCLFETTSLYGSSKSVSQYDGMKPYIRFKGLTDSNFVPMLDGDAYKKLKDYIEEKTGEELVDPDGSSKKLKATLKAIGLVKSSLRGTPELERFNQVIEKAKGLTERKRYYISNYGFKNYIDVVNGKTDILIPDDENYDKFYMKNIIDWWKKKASSRYDTLKSEGRLRSEIEVWTSGKPIDIIR
jgi:hypothetical protein